MNRKAAVFLRQAALAALLPNTFLQALVWRTLTASALPEVTEDEGL